MVPVCTAILAVQCSVLLLLLLDVGGCKCMNGKGGLMLLMLTYRCISITSENVRGGVHVTRGMHARGVTCQ